MFCSACGVAVSPASKFCFQCGAPVLQGKAAASASPLADEAESPAPTPTAQNAPSTPPILLGGPLAIAATVLLAHGAIVIWRVLATREGVDFEWAAGLWVAVLMTAGLGTAIALVITALSATARSWPWRAWVRVAIWVFVGASLMLLIGLLTLTPYRF